MALRLGASLRLSQCIPYRHFVYKGFSFLGVMYMFTFKCVSGVIFVRRNGASVFQPFLSMVDAIKWTLTQAINTKAGL